jgi:hypothetical protein
MTNAASGGVLNASYAINEKPDLDRRNGSWEVEHQLETGTITPDWIVTKSLFFLFLNYQRKGLQ